MTDGSASASRWVRRAVIEGDEKVLDASRTSVGLMGVEGEADTWNKLWTEVEEPEKF